VIEPGIRILLFTLHDERDTSKDTTPLEVDAAVTFLD
jgi:hypothetical protein